MICKIKSSVYVKEKDSGKHREFNKQLFSSERGWKVKLLLSSFSFMNKGARGS